MSTRAFASLLLVLAACVQVSEPPCPTAEVPETSAENSLECYHCLKADMEGRIFRLTRMVIDEPDAFAALLNEMWKGDINNNILNVIIRVDSMLPGYTTPEPGEGDMAFKWVTITVGPAWRIPKFPYISPAESGQPMDTPITSYCHLKDLSFQMKLVDFRGYQCMVENKEPQALYFHSGPKDAPLICAPENSPANNIPVTSLKIRTSFNDDCTEIHEAYLEGCITVDAADRICMCPGAAGTCPRFENPTYTFDGNDLDGYCKSACGEDWISFGALLKAAPDLKPTCITEDGSIGYRVQGYFDATTLPKEKFNPVSSDDCQQTGGTP
jgi:hypothetical protein